MSDRYQKRREWRVEDLPDPVQDHPEPALIAGIPAQFLRSISWHWPSPSSRQAGQTDRRTCGSKRRRIQTFPRSVTSNCSPAELSRSVLGSAGAPPAAYRWLLVSLLGLMVTDSCSWVQHLITADADTLLFRLQQLAIVSSDIMSFVSAGRQQPSCWFAGKHVFALSITPIWLQRNYGLRYSSIFFFLFFPQYKRDQIWLLLWQFSPPPHFIWRAADLYQCVRSVIIQSCLGCRRASRVMFHCGGTEEDTQSAR